MARLFLRVFWVLKQKRYLVEYLVNVLKGLLVVATNRDSIKFGPPLIITKKDLNKSMRIVDESIEEFIYENSKKN